MLVQFVIKAWRFRKLFKQQRDEIFSQARYAQKQQRAEGEMNIKTPPTQKPADSKEGDYVDFEEID